MVSVRDSNVAFCRMRQERSKPWPKKLVIDGMGAGMVFAPLACRHEMDSGWRMAEFTARDFAAKTVAWRSKNSVKPGKELVWFDGASARGSLIYYDDQFVDLQRPYQVNYRYLWDDDFILNQATIEVSMEGRPSSTLYLFRRGTWQTAEGEVVAPSSCLDLDLWPSPLTNSLTLRRLRLTVGERRQIVALYVEAPSLEVRRDIQIYTRVDESSFYFESPSSSFRSLITVDRDFLVLDYPGYFQREA